MSEAGSAAAARSAGFAELGDVIADEHFPAVDLALRRGRHVHKHDEGWYPFLLEAQGHLEAFYRRYGCELLHRSDGYFFLLPQTDELGKRQLSVPEMIVGQGLALAYLDPRTLESGGCITREELLERLATAMGTEGLMGALNPQRRRPDERVMQRTVRQKVAEALRRLAQLGFVELLPDERLRLPPSLLRFAEPVRGAGSPAAALAQLLARGEIRVGAEEAEGEAAVVHPETVDLEAVDLEAVDLEADAGADSEAVAEAAADAEAEMEAEAAATDAERAQAAAERARRDAALAFDLLEAVTDSGDDEA